MKPLLEHARKHMHGKGGQRFPLKMRSRLSLLKGNVKRRFKNFLREGGNSENNEKRACRNM